MGVTGAAGSVGSLLLRRLRKNPDVAKVIAFDIRRGDVGGVLWRIGDIRDPLLRKRLAGVDVLVHLAADRMLDHLPATRTSVNVDGTRAVTQAAAAAGVRHLVLVTSAMVYGAEADNPVPLPEDAHLRAEPDGLLADLLAVEAMARELRQEVNGPQVTVVRPAAMVGVGVDTMVSRHFAAPWLLSVRDAHPLWQFCHIEDLAGALEHVALGRADRGGQPPPVVTVGCDGWLEQSEVEAISGRKRVAVPAALAFATAARLHRLGVTPAPASELAYVVHPWVIDAHTLRVSGWRAQYDNVDALRIIMDQVDGEHVLVGRRLGRRDATVAGASAAGATAAVLGAAVLVHRVRRIRGH